MRAFRRRFIRNHLWDRDVHQQFIQGNTKLPTQSNQPQYFTWADGKNLKAGNSVAPHVGTNFNEIYAEPSGALGIVCKYWPWALL